MCVFFWWQHFVRQLGVLGVELTCVGLHGAAPELATSVGTGMAQTSKGANSERIAFLTVLRGSITR